MDIIHLNWEKHIWNDEIFDKFNSRKDIGIYQIYGYHPVYGEDTLLYIGQTQKQTYSVRLKQHNKEDTSRPEYKRIHLSYFQATKDINFTKWKNYYIDKVERLLINAHFPALNKNFVKGVLKPKEHKDGMIILNWYDYGKLLPEVSSLRYSYDSWSE